MSRHLIFVNQAIARWEQHGNVSRAPQAPEGRSHLQAERQRCVKGCRAGGNTLQLYKPMKTAGCFYYTPLNKQSQTFSFLIQVPPSWHRTFPLHVLASRSRFDV